MLLRDVGEHHEKEAYSLIFDKEEQMDLRNGIRRDLKASFQSTRVCCLPLPHEKIRGGVYVRY